MNPHVLINTVFSGNPDDAGILPRGLDVLFNSISGKQWPGMDLKPRMFCDVVKLSPEEEERERKIKERTLRLNSGEVRMKDCCGALDARQWDVTENSQ